MTNTSDPNPGGGLEEGGGGGEEGAQGMRRIQVKYMKYPAYTAQLHQSVAESHSCVMYFYIYL
jgi:hypothetical protein